MSGWPFKLICGRCEHVRRTTCEVAEAWFENLGTLDMCIRVGAVTCEACGYEGPHGWDAAGSKFEDA